MTPSLEEERRALLEQIEASRAVYRRMLSGDEGGAASTATHGQANAASASGEPGRGRAVQWMMEHPLWVAGGVALLVLLAPRMMGAGARAARHRRQAKRRERQLEWEHERERAAGGGTARALLTAAALLLRDPARMRAAARYAQMAWGWIRERQSAKSERTVTTVTPTARVKTRVH